MTIESWGLPLAITVLAVGVRCVIDKNYASLSGVIQAILLGLLTGSIANLYLLDYLGDNGELLSHTKRTAYVGIASAFSQEIFIWMKGMMANPLDLLRRGKNGS